MNMFQYIKHRVGLLFALRKICTNWLYSLLCAYGIIKSEKIICQMRNGIKISMPKYPSNLEVIVENWLPERGAHYFSNFKEILPKSVMIDIGANIGTFTLYMVRKCKGLTIFCYEPDEENFKCLKENIKLNSLHNTFTYEMAVGAQNNSVKIYSKKDRKFGTTGSSTTTKTENYKIVRCTTLKDIIEKNNVQKCDLLKLDCEGAEYEILLSQGEDCFNRIDSIILEYHDFESLNHNHHDLENHLKKFGFKVEALPFKGRPTGMMKATKF